MQNNHGFLMTVDGKRFVGNRSFTRRFSHLLDIAHNIRHTFAPQLRMDAVDSFVSDIEWRHTEARWMVWTVQGKE